jgi:hypothetical protein
MESENVVKTLKFIIGIAEMSLDQVVKILDMQLANDYYLLFTKALQSRISSYCTPPRSGPL